MLLRSHDGGDMKDQDRARWTKLVADYEASDLAQRKFASERGVSFSNLRNWIYRLRQESRPLVTQAPASSRQVPPVSGAGRARGEVGSRRAAWLRRSRWREAAPAAAASTY